MTDNEIIKALEYCSNPDNTCKKCDLYVAGDFDGCKCASKLKLEVVDLIKRKNAKIKSFEGKTVIQNGLIDRQKAAIEELRAINESLKADRPFIIAEAVKEFAERLKNLDVDTYYSYASIVYELSEDDIDNLVKEMVGAE